ncbi:retrovirus-related pol polyprotein from transposon TNT 1-94 [Tanacetum coccineum]
MLNITYVLHVKWEKARKKSHKPKPEPSSNAKLHMLLMDLCGPMHVESISKKKYILVIVDDYSQFTWVKFLRMKDETPEIIIKFVKQAQTLRTYMEDVGITHQISIERILQQNGGVERCNHTLVDVARTTLIFSKCLLFLWAEAVSNACYTLNQSLIHTRYNKTLYELLRGPELQPMTSGHISSGLIPNQAISTLAKPLSKKDLDLLFQPMFDAYCKPPPSVVSLPIFAATLPTPYTAETSSSITID